LRKKLRNDDKPFNSLSFATFEKKNKEMTMSWGSSPSSATPEKKKQKNDDKPGRLAVICYT